MLWDVTFVMLWCVTPIAAQMPRRKPTPFRRKPTPQPQKTYTSNGSKPDFSAENLHLNRRKPTPFRRKPTPLDFQKVLKSPEITGFLALPSAPYKYNVSR